MRYSCAGSVGQRLVSVAGYHRGRVAEGSGPGA